MSSKQIMMTTSARKIPAGFVKKMQQCSHRDVFREGLIICFYTTNNIEEWVLVTQQRVLTMNPLGCHNINTEDIVKMNVKEDKNIEVVGKENSFLIFSPFNVKPAASEEFFKVVDQFLKSLRYQNISSDSNQLQAQENARAAEEKKNLNVVFALTAIVISFVVFGMISSVFAPKPLPKQTITTTNVTQEEEIDPSEGYKLIFSLEKGVEKAEKELCISINNIHDLDECLSGLDATARVYEEVNRSITSKGHRVELERVKNKIISLQEDKYPIVRDKFGIQYRKLMSSFGMNEKIKTTDTKYKTVRFIGSAFSSYDYQNRLYNLCENYIIRLRFDKVEFSSTSSQKAHSTRELVTFSDSDIVIWEEDAGFYRKLL